MAGSWTAAFHQDIMQVIQDATAAPAPLSASTWWLVLTHTTLTDAYAITDTGRMGANSTDFHLKFTNSTATWTLADSTSPSKFNNKVVLTVTTGDFAAPAQTTVKGFFLASTNSTAAGVVYAWGDISPTQAVSTGNTIQFTTGQLVLRSGGGAAT
jgi:hypothetical protein